MNKTLYDKIFNNNILDIYSDLFLLYVNKILLHEVTSPQAFFSLKKRFLWNKNSIYSTSDHNVSTEKKNRFFYNKNIKQLNFIRKSSKKYFFQYYDLNHPKQGIIHITSCENYILFPGMIIICGDSHTTTNGALSILAIGVGTSDLEIAISTQCIVQKKMKNMNILFFNNLNYGSFSKDLVLYIIKKITSKGGVNFSIEFSGKCIEKFSISERMTICNMSIEAGSKSSLISPDKKTILFYKKKINVINLFLNYIDNIKSNKANFDKYYFFNASDIKPHITWGTNLDTIIEIDETIKTNDFKMLEYMGLNNNISITNLKVDKVFIGSCTNSRFEDLLICIKLLLKINKKKHKNVISYIVPGSEFIRIKSEFYGINLVFDKYNFIWRNSGCSMCLAMNDDRLNPFERCVSTSNRNFIGRQGYKGRTHLSSPFMAILISIYGKFIDYNLYKKYI